MKKLNLIFLLFTAFTLVSCATSARREASAGQIGCPKDEVTISNENSGWGTASWTASCRGQKFYCSAVSDGQYGGATVNCKEELKSKKRRK